MVLTSVRVELKISNKEPNTARSKNNVSTFSDFFYSPSFAIMTMSHFFKLPLPRYRGHYLWIAPLTKVHRCSFLAYNIRRFAVKNTNEIVKNVDWLIDHPVPVIKIMCSSFTKLIFFLFIRSNVINLSTMLTYQLLTISRQKKLENFLNLTSDWHNLFIIFVLFVNTIHFWWNIQLNHLKCLSTSSSGETSVTTYNLGYSWKIMTIVAYIIHDAIGKERWNLHKTFSTANWIPTTTKIRKILNW